MMNGHLLEYQDDESIHVDTEVGPWMSKKISQSTQAKSALKLVNIKRDKFAFNTKTRKLSTEYRKSNQFIERQIYDRQRSIQKIINDFFVKENVNSKNNSKDNVGFFVQKKPSLHRHTTAQHFQTSKSYFDKMTIKIQDSFHPSQYIQILNSHPKLPLQVKKKTIVESDNNFLIRNGKMPVWKMLA